jgi:hypothetical protein
MNDYLFLALIELGALAALAFVTLVVLLYSRRRRIEAATQAAANQLREREEDRHRTLTAILSGVHRLPESVSAGLSTQLMQCERTLLRQCFDILLSLDPASAARLSGALLAGLDDYLRKCAAPNIPRMEYSGEKEPTAVPEEGEKLPYWMNKLEKEGLPAEGDAVPEFPLNPTALWPASAAQSEEMPAETPATAEALESAPADALPPLVDAAEEDAPLPAEETEAAEPIEIARPSDQPDYAAQIGGLLDAYDLEHTPSGVTEAAGLEASPEKTDEAPAETLPQAERAENERDESLERSAASFREMEETGEIPTEPDSSELAPFSPATTVEALMAEFGLALSPGEKPVSLPRETPAAASEPTPEARSDGVDALLAEFGFHDAPTPPQDALPPQANPAAVDALLAEFSFAPDAGERDELAVPAAPPPARSATRQKNLEMEAESLEAAAPPRRGRRKSAMPE